MDIPILNIYGPSPGTAAAAAAEGGGHQPRFFICCTYMNIVNIDIILKLKAGLKCINLCKFLKRQHDCH